MYEIFNPFLDRDTWHTNHPTDDQVFYLCLHKVVRDAAFSPDEMKQYFVSYTGKSLFDLRIDYLTTAAWGVHDYLKAVG